MENKAAARITRVRLVEPAPFGFGAVVEASIGVDSGSYYGGQKITLDFDKDDRFIRVGIGNWRGLIPYSNIALIQLEPAA